MKRLPLLSSTLLLGAISLIAAGISASGRAEPPPPDPGAQAFAQCQACHTVQKGGRNGIGPNLNGLFGRQAGSAPGFSYSPALKASKLRWDDKTLNDFLANPQRKVPGSRMPISVSDPVKRAAIITYLKAQTAK